MCLGWERHGANPINKLLVILWGARTYTKHDTRIASLEGPAVVSINLFVRSIATISDIKMVSPETAAESGTGRNATNTPKKHLPI